jgi:hypothetical protein
VRKVSASGGVISMCESLLEEPDPNKIDKSFPHFHRMVDRGLKESVFADDFHSGRLHWTSIPTTLCPSLTADTQKIRLFMAIVIYDGESLPCEEK